MIAHDTAAVCILVPCIDGRICAEDGCQIIQGIADACVECGFEHCAAALGDGDTADSAGSGVQVIFRKVGEAKTDLPLFVCGEGRYVFKRK